MTYDPIHRKWLAVPRRWVMADFSKYAYPATDGSLHVVDLTTGIDTVLPDGNRIGTQLMAVEPDGVYGAAGATSLARVDWNGHYAVVDQGHYVSTIAVGDGVAFGSTEAPPFHDLDRIDLRTGAVTPWFRWASRTLTMLGVDSAGFPVLETAARGERSFYDANAVSTTDEPTGGQSLASWIADANLGTVTFAQDHDGFWFETALGIVRWDSALPYQAYVGYGRTGYIAGSCA